LITVRSPACSIHVLGLVLTLLGLAGFLIGILGAPGVAVATVSGVASGVALFASVGVASTQHRQVPLERR
jgi:hypothetical protein